MDEEQSKNFEYKEVIIDERNKSFLLKGYESFGWEEEEAILRYDNFEHYPGKMLLRLKRSYKITNRMELIRLQRKFEACVKEVEKLEKSKTLFANMYSLGIGMVGTGFLIRAWMLLCRQSPEMKSGILFLVIGILGWIFPVYIYKATLKKDSEKINPYIEEKYEEIMETCKKGNRLLYRAQ